MDYKIGGRYKINENAFLNSKGEVAVDPLLFVLNWTDFTSALCQFPSGYPSPITPLSQCLTLEEMK